MSLLNYSEVQRLLFILKGILDVNWTVFGIWWALTIGAVILKRMGSLWSLLGLLHLPLVLLVGVWCWGREGFSVFGNTLLLTGCTKAAVLVMASGLITLRRLGHLQAPGLGRVLRSVIDGPAGLSTAVDLLISAVMPRGAKSKGEDRSDAAGGSDSPFAAAGGAAGHPELEGAAHDVEATFQQLWNSGYEALLVDPKTFKHLDLAFYDRFRDFLVNYGFTHAGDLEVVSARIPGVKRTFIRVMLSADHAVMASCNHLKLGIGMGLLTLGAKNFITQTTEFESEFTDGSFVVTTNQTAVGNFDHGDRINSVCFEGLTLEELGHRHYQRLAEHGKGSGAGLVSIRTVDDINASQARLQSLKSAGRGAEGMKRDEFRRAAGSNGKMADELYDAWQASRRQASV